MGNIYNRRNVDYDCCSVDVAANEKKNNWEIIEILL